MQTNPDTPADQLAAAPAPTLPEEVYDLVRLALGTAFILEVNSAYTPSQDAEFMMRGVIAYASGYVQGALQHRLTPPPDANELKALARDLITTVMATPRSIATDTFADIAERAAAQLAGTDLLTGKPGA
jgi:hypothetical protein